MGVFMYQSSSKPPKILLLKKSSVSNGFLQIIVQVDVNLHSVQYSDQRCHTISLRKCKKNFGHTQLLPCTFYHLQRISQMKPKYMCGFNLDDTWVPWQFIARTLCRIHCKPTLPSLNHSDFHTFPNPRILMYMLDNI